MADEFEDFIQTTETEFEAYRAGGTVHLVVIDKDDEGDIVFLEMTPEEAEALGQRLIEKAQQDKDDEEIIQR